MSWRTGVGILSLMMTACAPTAPVQREPLITRDARGAQRLSMMRYQEALASSKASAGAKIEAHAQLGQYFHALAQARAERAEKTAHKERAQHHFKAATTMWSRHRRQVSQARMAYIRGLIAQTYFYQAELASEPLFELEGASSASRHSDERRAHSAFQIAFHYYRSAFMTAMEGEDMARQVAVLTRQGQLLEQLALLMSDAHNDLPPDQRRQARHQSLLRQAKLHYQRAVAIELSAQDAQGQHWRGLAQDRLCGLDKSRCVSQ